MQIPEITNNDKYSHLNIAINPNTAPHNGFVFIFPSWSVTYSYLLPLLDTLVKLKYKDPIYIYDIDDNTCQTFLNNHNFISHGYGEIFYIKNGKIDKILVQAAPLITAHNAAIVKFVEGII